VRPHVLAVLLLFGCRKEPVPEAKPILELDARAPADHRAAGSWTRDGVEWRAVVIGKLPRAELRRLAERLHSESPKVFFDLYDDDAELPKLVAAQGDDDVLTPAWREAHAIGTIAGTVGVTNGQVVIKNVQLYEWKTGESTPLP
jgi:hypothetical protein